MSEPSWDIVNCELASSVRRNHSKGIRLESQMLDMSTNLLQIKAFQVLSIVWQGKYVMVFAVLQQLTCITCIRKWHVLDKEQVIYPKCTRLTQ